MSGADGPPRGPSGARRRVPGPPDSEGRTPGRAGSAAALPRTPQPVALLYGRGRLIVHANPAFVVEFGATCLGLPAAEALPSWPRRAFEVIDRAWDARRPLATWVSVVGRRRRLIVAPRADEETGEVYGVAIRLAEEAAPPA
jgi:hypothetical protein